jgi:hypothetical protein
VTFLSIADDTYYNTVSLGDTTFSSKLVINATNLFVNSNLRDPDYSHNSTIELYTHDTYIYPSATVSAAWIFIYALGTVQISEGVTIESTQQNACTTDPTGNLDLFQCMPTDYQDESITEARVLDYYNRQYSLNESSVGYATLPSDMAANVMSKWHVYILAMDSIWSNEQTTITAPRVGVCSDNIKMISTQINANGKGCPAGQGLGAGL